MKIDKNKQEKQEKAFTEIFKIAEEAGIDLISVRDEDILFALENEKDILEKLTPEICTEIRSNIVNIISEEYYKFIAEAVSMQFPDEDFGVSEEELNSPEAKETSEEDETKAWQLADHRHNAFRMTKKTKTEREEAELQMSMIAGKHKIVYVII